MLQHKNTSLLKIAVAGFLCLLSTAAMAQETNAANTDSINMLEYTLVITALLLVAVIWLLAQVLVTLSKSILKKKKIRNA